MHAGFRYILIIMISTIQTATPQHIYRATIYVCYTYRIICGGMKMKKMVLIAIALIAMIGIGAANPDGSASPAQITVNINTDAPTSITFQWWDLSSSTMNATKFYVFKDNNIDGVPDDLDGIGGNGNVPGDTTNELELSWNGTTTYTNSGFFTFLIPPFSFDSVEIDLPTTGETRYTQTIWVRDANTGATLNDRYIIIGTLGGATAVIPQVSTSTDIIPVPEFPTIALPVAAILGLAFIIQRRREED